MIFLPMDITILGWTLASIIYQMIMQPLKTNEETEGTGVGSLFELKLPEPLSGNVPEPASVSDNSILLTEITGID